MKGQRCFYVHPKDLKRKTVVKSLIKLVGERRKIDYILYVGSEKMNEYAFEYLNQQLDA